MASEKASVKLVPLTSGESRLCEGTRILTLVGPLSRIVLDTVEPSKLSYAPLSFVKFVTVVLSDSGLFSDSSLQLKKFVDS